MALAGKQEVDIEIKSSIDKFYSALKSQIQHLPNISSDKVHAVEVHEGDWEASGSVKLWKFTVEGQVESIKDKVEIEEANKCISFRALEGDILKNYKSYKSSVKVNENPKGEGASVKITVDYEKANDEVPVPQKYLDFVVNVIKDIDAHVLN